MKSLRRLTSLLIVLAVSAALTACGGGKAQTDESEASLADSAESSEPTYGGSVTVGMTQEPVSLDPHVTTDAGTKNVVFNIYEGLVKATSDGDLEPAVASAYTISEDAMVYTFTLREGIVFHDGSAVTVDDVKYSIERYAEIQGESSALFYLDEVTVPDDETIVVTLTEPNSELLAELTLAIIPESNDDPEGNPIGTGPFYVESYTAGVNIVLAKNEDYWKDGYPYLDEVTFKFDDDVDTAYMELLAGTIDILNYLTIDQVESLSDDFTIITGSMNLVHALYLNNDYEPLSDVRVRQALCYAVDRDEINDFLFGGESTLIGSSMIPSITKYYNEETADTYEYDIDAAKALLEEAGYGDGFDLVITVPSSYSQHVSTAEIIADQLEEIGINVTIEQVEWTSWLSDVYTNRDYEATVVGVDATLAPGDWFSRYRSDADNNFVNYSSDEFDALFDAAQLTVDEDEKIEFYKQIQQVLADDAASVYIEDPADFVAVNGDLCGYLFYPVSAQDMSTVYYAQQQED